MNTPNAWRGRAFSNAYAFTRGVELGMFFAFAISAYAAHIAEARELAACLAGLSIAALVVLGAFR